MSQKNVPVCWPDLDVRNDPLGVVNRLLNWIFARGGILARLVAFTFHIEFPRINHPVRFPHPFCIVVNGGAVVGSNVTIYQGVTIGSKRYGARSGAPVIEDHVVIFPNAVIVGGVTLGAGSIVQAGSVVIDDVPALAVVAGNPAKVIGHQGKAVG